MSNVESPVAPALPGLRVHDQSPGFRPVGFHPAPRPEPAGFRHALRGKMLYPALLAMLSVASWVVTRDKDNLR